MKRELESALEHVERIIGSINFSGYFTRAIAEGLAPVLGAVAVFRLHYEENDAASNLIHSYILPERDIKQLLEQENISYASDWRVKKLELLSNYCKRNFSLSDYNKVSADKISKVNLQLEQVHIDNLSLSSVPKDIINIKSKIYIPLIVKHYIYDKNEIICDPFADQHNCKVITGHSCAECDYKISGLIEIYSDKSIENLASIVGNVRFKKEYYLGRINSLFYIQEEPFCFGAKQNFIEKICSHCSVRESCWLGYPPTDSKSDFRTNDLLSKLHPDKVINQLFEKCKEILPKDVEAKIAFLSYRADLRKFQYRAVQYMDSIKYKELSTLEQSNLQTKYQLDDEELSVLTDWFKGLKKSLIGDPDNKNYHIYQDISDISEDLFNTLYGQLILVEKTKIDGEIYNRDHRLDGQKPTDGKGQSSDRRKDLELLVFPYPFFIAMPVFYLGQLLGFIFANFQPPELLVKLDETLIETTWSKIDFDNFRKHFFNISVDFGPLLYHSLVFHFMSEVVDYYSDTSKQNNDKDIHAAVMLNIPKVMNASLVTFWRCDEKHETCNREPQIAVGFKKIEIGAELSTLDSCVIEIAPSIINGVHKSGRPCLYELKNLSEEQIQFHGQTYGAGEASVHIALRSLLLLPIKDKELENIGLPQGVYGFFFENLSPYVLQRNAIDIHREISGIFNTILLGESGKRKIINHGTKAAVAAIISRNHSHHIGSHVMPRTTIEKIIERLDYLYNGKFNDDAKLKIINLLKNRLDEYIQKKADFIAEIATEPMTTTKNMKLFDEVILYFITTTLITDNIGANEGVTFKSGNDNRLKIRFQTQANGQDVTELTASFKGSCSHLNKHNNMEYSMFCSECLIDSTPLLRVNIEPNDRDIIIAVPGSLGEFAFYAFLENFIRNGIKHNKSSIDLDKQKDFEVFVSVSEIDNDRYFYKVKIWDNFTNPMVDVPITENDGTTKYIKLHEYLNQCIRNSIINKDGTLRKESWGIAEMKIMATLLRGSTEFVDMSRNLNVSYFEHDGDIRLVYEFAVMRPKNVAVISNGIDPVSKKEQEKQGIWWFKSFNDYHNHIALGDSPATFKFLIVDRIEDCTDETSLKIIKPLMPFRVLSNNDELSIVNKTIYGTAKIEASCMEEIKVADGVKILRIAWMTWLQQLMKNKSIEKAYLLMYFQQENTEQPRLSWIIASNDNPLICLATNYITANLDSSDNNSKIILYDRHFGMYTDFINKIPFKAKNVLIDNIIFHEVYDKNSSDFIHIFSPFEEEMKYKLVESALLNVLVIDERIAEVANSKLIFQGEENESAKELYGGNERLLVAKKTNLYICTHVSINNKDIPQPLHSKNENAQYLICAKFSISRDNNDIIDKVSVAIHYCNNSGCRSCNSPKIKIDAVIIHQGVLENFFKVLKNKNEYDVFLELLQHDIPYVIIDSGRGIPAKLPSAAKFLPFSLLEDFLMKERFAKYSLVQNIMSLVRRKNYE